MRTRLTSIGMLLAALAAGVSIAHAQPAPDSQLMFDPGALKAEPSRPAATPQSKRNTAKTTRQPETTSQPWLLDPVDDAATGRRVRMKTPKPATEPGPGLGRVPLQSGSFGLETDTQLKAYQFPDGRNVLDKGIKNASQPSYFGLSVTVPTDSKTFSPFLPRSD